VQNVTIQERFKIKPDVLLESDEWFNLEVLIQEQYNTTRTRIDQLKAITVEMSCYYQYQLAAIARKKVVLFPDNVKKVYRFGEREVRTHSFTLIESSK